MLNFTAFSTASASLINPKDNRNIMAADKIVANGFTLPLGKSGADPWQGSYKPNALFLSGNDANEAEGNNPSDPGITDASSEIMSPKMLLVKTTPFNCVGFLTKIMAAESINWCSNSTLGNSFSRVSVTTFLHNLEDANTLALSNDHTLSGGCSWSAKNPAILVIRCTSATLYASVSEANPLPLSSTRSPK